MYCKILHVKVVSFLHVGGLLSNFIKWIGAETITRHKYVMNKVLMQI